MAQKMEKDFSDVVDKSINENDGLISKGQLGEAIENLLNLEKRTRLAGDAVSTARISVKIVEWCHQLKDYKTLQSTLHLLVKRRAQIKSAIKEMVKKCMEFLPVLPYDTKMDIINSLIEVTEGKIFMEKQRARLTLLLAGIREKEGKIAEAANILQEVQVETFGSMKKKEKTEFILEQMRLCLAKKDFIRTQIISRKISTKVFEDESFQELKIKYHNQMIQYYSNSQNYLDIFRSHQSIYNTPIIQNNEAEWKLHLSLSVLYIILSPYGNEQNDLLNRLATEKSLEALPVYYDLVKKFLKIEILHWKEILDNSKSELEKLPVFCSKNHLNSQMVEKVWSDLHVRVTEHNIRVISQYYSRINLSRLAKLLDLDENEAEIHMSSLVTNKSVYARLDRVTGIINFIKPQEASQVMNDWSHDISSLLNLMDRTCHLIQREYMMKNSNMNSQVPITNAMEIDK